MVDLKPSVAKYQKALEKAFASNSMVVFLCGPSAKTLPAEGAALRVRLHNALAAENFEVVLGEDDGLAQLQERYGQYAHVNERQFVETVAAAIVLVADSVGSFCELGMFADQMIKHGKPKQQDFILIADSQYKANPSYFNLGPAKVVEDHWVVHYTDLSTFDVSKVVDRLKRRRTLVKSETRGRPRS